MSYIWLINYIYIYIYTLLPSSARLVMVIVLLPLLLPLPLLLLMMTTTTTTTTLVTMTAKIIESDDLGLASRSKSQSGCFQWRRETFLAYFGISSSHALHDVVVNLQEEQSQPYVRNAGLVLGTSFVLDGL